MDLPHIIHKKEYENIKLDFEASLTNYYFYCQDREYCPKVGTNLRCIAREFINKCRFNHECISYLLDFSIRTFYPILIDYFDNDTYYHCKFIELPKMNKEDVIKNLKKSREYFN